MNRMYSIFQMVLIAFLLATGSAVGAGKAEPPDAQVLIDRCWAISLAQRSTGSASLHELGHKRTIQCLENAALSQMELIFDQKSGLSRKAALERLRTLIHAANHVYLPIFNDNKFCGSNCGMAGAIAHLPQTAKILEQIIRTVFTLRTAYEGLR